MKQKVYNRIFTEACYCFVNFMPYYNHMAASLRMMSQENQAEREQLRADCQKDHREFDEHVWKDLQKIYDQLFPRFLKYSFLVSACSIFEYQLKRICDLVKEEHKMPFGWDMDDSKDSALNKMRRFLGYAGVVLKDDLPRTEFPPPDFKPTEIFDEDRVIVKELWRSLGDYFMVRNCIVHNNGLIDEARSPERLGQYAAQEKIVLDNHGQHELLINEVFNREACHTMGKFFDKLRSAYYSSPLPE
ncbi:MAG: hypothetical protein HY665_07215 [Chloroflexi bacterium]|nr:hypothetical protein [Chloroflexota bacterium]